WAAASAKATGTRCWPWSTPCSPTPAEPSGLGRRFAGRGGGRLRGVRAAGRLGADRDQDAPARARAGVRGRVLRDDDVPAGLLLDHPRTDRRGESGGPERGERFVT